MDTLNYRIPLDLYYCRCLTCNEQVQGICVHTDIGIIPWRNPLSTSGPVVSFTMVPCQHHVDGYEVYGVHMLAFGLVRLGSGR